MASSLQQELGEAGADPGGSARSPSAASASTRIKICGVTTPEDAAMAAEAGAHFVGMILWPHARRSVALPLAAEISAAARRFGAVPVGVFVEESAEDIQRACEQADVAIAQLHGDGARASLRQLAPALPVACVLHADKGGRILTPLPAKRGERLADYVLVDSLQGGSGEAFDWANLSVPRGVSSRGWILAGGLTPENVVAAIAALRPDVVDVSSGVTGPDKLKKDRQKVQSFIEAVRSTSSQ